MKISVECYDKGDHIVVAAAGDWTQPSAEHILDTARREADERGVTRILLDLRFLSLPEDELTRYYGGEYLAKVLPPPYRVAGVGGRPDRVNYFAETVAVNRGAQMRAFEEKGPAIQWLLTDS